MDELQAPLPILLSQGPEGSLAIAGIKERAIGTGEGHDSIAAQHQVPKRLRANIAGQARACPAIEDGLVRLDPVSERPGHQRIGREAARLCLRATAAVAISGIPDI